MVINAAVQVAELCVLDAPPFPINFRRAMCTVPAVPSDSSPDSCTHTHVIRAVKMLEGNYANHGKPSQLLTSTLLPGKRAHKVAFVDHLPMQPTADESATVVSLGSVLEPDYAVDANDDANEYDLCNLPLSMGCSLPDSLCPPVFTALPTAKPIQVAT